MTESNLDKVKGVLAAMRAGDAEKALQRFDPRFVQHATFIADGVEGLRQYLVGSTPNRLELSVIRAIEDGPFVVAQLKAEASGENVFDVYRFQDGFIAEHWAFSSPDAPPNKSGRTQTDGPTQPRFLRETERNKSIVSQYYKIFHLAGKHDEGSEFFTGDVMIRHEPGVHDGLSEFLRDVEVLMQHRTIDELRLIVGEGDLIFIAAMGRHDKKDCAYIDLYRVEHEKIVEHWGFPQTVPPQSERCNWNDML